MEKSLEQSMHLLLTQLANTEQRHARMQRQLRWLGFAFGLTLVLLFGMVFKVQLIDDVRADVLKELEVDVHNLNTILAGGAQLMQQMQQAEQQQGGVIVEIGRIIKNLDAVLAGMTSESSQEMLGKLGAIANALATKENAEALKSLDDIIIMTDKMLKGEIASGNIASEINNLFGQIQSMSHNMYVMSVDMHRMSSTATPAMGRMNDMMSVMPLP